MMHDFEFKSAAEMPRPYDPRDYNLPVWREEDHQQPNTVEQEQKLQTEDSIIEDYTNRAIAIANDNSHGYSQQNRWGPDYDCSSMVIQCLQNAGIPAKDHGATFTGNMRKVLLDCGFKNVTDSCDCVTAIGMKRGDILLNDVNHTAIYLGNGQIVHARSSEGNSLQGDQSGNEIRIQPYYNYPWTAVLRYAGDKPTNVPTTSHVPETAEEPEPRSYALRLPYLRRGSFGELVAAVQTLLILEGYPCGPDGADGDFGLNTEKAVREFQEQLGLTADGIVGPETGAALFDTEVYTPEDKTEPKADSFWNNLLLKIRKM